MSTALVTSSAIIFNVSQCLFIFVHHGQPCGVVSCDMSRVWRVAVVAVVAGAAMSLWNR